MQITDDLRKFIKEGLEHFIANRDKEAAWLHIKDRIENIGFLDRVQTALREAIAAYIAEEGEDENQNLVEQIMRRSLLESIGIEHTVVDRSSSKMDSEDHSAPPLAP